MNEFFILFFLVIFAVITFIIVWSKRKREEVIRKISRLADNTLEISPEEFFEIRNSRVGSFGKAYVSSGYSFPGVYILFNQTKNLYYVGQGQKVLDRVNSHFTGRGNGDVYADYKYGDEFTIKMIALEKSGFSTLNELERDTIAVYNAYYDGYNKTRGNR